ncbi:MAG: hypothetical protein E7413_07900 [Ruminococcaceae bacterium]|nr:hypothetical protein [Oscillospiraceae bacterium]
MKFINMQVQTKTNHRLAESGVVLYAPSTCYIGEEVIIGQGTKILPNTVIFGKTVIGTNCVIGPNTVIEDCMIGNDNEILSSHLTKATVENGVKIGPFAYLRPDAHIKNNAKIGDFCEIKNAIIGEGSKVSHLTYIGDSDVGKGCNFGCGSVVANYNGKEKFRSKIGDHAFIGCNTNLVSPVIVGDLGYTAAGSTITQNVPEGALAIARAKQENKMGWVKRKGYLNK